MYSRAVNYFSNGRYDKSLELLQKEIKQNPSREAYMAIGCVYMATGESDKARISLEKAVYGDLKYLQKGRSGFYSEAACNLGLMYYYIEDDDTALDVYREAIKHSPDTMSTGDWMTIWNYSNVRLRQYMSDKYSNLKLCWQLYEARFRYNQRVELQGLPNWTGSQVDSITVLGEQGYGDNIMFARYLPEVAKRCSRLVVQCTPDFEFLFKDYETRVLTQYDTTHAVAIGSLGNLLDYIPSGEWIGGWTGGSGKIACVWESNSVHANKRFRNTDVSHVLKLAEKFDNICSLGPDCSHPLLEHLPSSTWEETYNTLKTVDLVVSIDSAVVHMCGAMGVPCLALMPLKNADWRWGDSSCGHNNKWYKSVKVIRNPNNWATVFEEVGDIIARSKQTGN